MKGLRCAAAFLLAALLTAAAFASSSTAVKPGDFVLRGTDNLPPPPFTSENNRFKTIVDCTNAAATLSGVTYKCDQSNLITVTKTCADEKAPHINLVKNSEGGWDEPDAAAFPVAGDDTQWRTLQWLFIHNPKWPDGFPNCWVRGWEDPDLWRVNAKAEPGNVFMERIEPGMTVEDIELPNIEDDYDCWPNDAECVPPVSHS